MNIFKVTGKWNSKKIKNTKERSKTTIRNIRDLLKENKTVYYKQKYEIEKEKMKN